MLENKTVCGAQVAARQNANKAETKRSHQHYVELDMRMLKCLPAKFPCNDQGSIYLFIYFIISSSTDYEGLEP